jgi:chromosome segregation ATPase
LLEILTEDRPNPEQISNLSLFFHRACEVLWLPQYASFGATKEKLLHQKEFVMSLKDSLQRKLQTQTDAWRKQIDKLRQDAETRKAKAEDDKAEAQIQQDVSKKIQELEASIDSALGKLEELRSAGEDKLKDLKKQIDSWFSGDAR